MRHHALANANGFTIHDSLPWAAEVANITAGAPKVNRVPTGGWRSYGAVPSHGYPYPTSVPGITTPLGAGIDGDYWQGIGQIGSTDSPDAQAAKTTEPAPPTTMQSIATMIASIGTAAGNIYKTNTEYEIAKDRLKAGAAVPSPQPTIPTGVYTPGQQEPAMQVGGREIPTWAIVAGVAGLGLVAVLALGRRK
jgi:hypothetical protein